VRLTWPKASNTVQVIDVLGREVRHQQLPAHAIEAVLDITGLVPGLYMVRCGAATSRLQAQ
jgi:hypothetical protein